MVNEVKFDQVDNVSSLLSPKKPQKSVHQHYPLDQTCNEGVSVQISSFHNMQAADNASEENTRVLEMKQRIQSGNYNMDTDELAKRIYHNIFQPNRIMG